MASPRKATVPENLQTTCKACGAPVVCAVSDATGEKVALDVSAYETYMLVVHEGQAVAKRSPAYVVHAALCGKREG